MRKHKKLEGSWKIMLLVAAIGFGGITAFMWANTTVAAVSKKGSSALSCENRVTNLYLAGRFLMPGTGEPMNLWIGKASASNKDVQGFVGKSAEGICEAQCKVVNFERYKKDLKPALMELDCVGTRLRTMRMPLHVQWIRDRAGFEAVVRLGSSIYGTERSPLQLSVNRYETMTVASAK